VSTVLVNVSERPVELHLAAGVVVLDPRARHECAPADLELGHVQALCRQGVLQEVEPEPEPPQEKTRRAPARRKRSAEKKN
jgi:hypothetical protein